RLRADQDALRIDAVKDIFKPLPLLTDQVVFGDRQAVDKDRVGIDGLAAHFLDALDIDIFAVEIGIEKRHAARRLAALIARRRADQQQDLVGPLRRRGPHLAAVDDIFAAVPFGFRLDRRSIEPGVGLGYAKAAAILTADKRWQHALFLLLRAIGDDRAWPKDIDMHPAATRVARARFRDCLHHDAGFGDAKPRAAILFGHGDPEPAI